MGALWVFEALQHVWASSANNNNVNNFIIVNSSTGSNNNNNANNSYAVAFGFCMIAPQSVYKLNIGFPGKEHGARPPAAGIRRKG